LTAAKTDYWVTIPPGHENKVPRGVLQVILEENLTRPFQPDQMALPEKTVEDVPLGGVAGSTGGEKEIIRKLAHRFSEADKIKELSSDPKRKDPWGTGLDK
jgi:hypothetical protein